MVILYAARHRLPARALARWLLALGILATLAANVAHGWSDGPVGAVVAAWPAASLVGSYELLLWLIRTTAISDAVRAPTADQPCGPADHPATGLRLVPAADASSPQRTRASRSAGAREQPAPTQVSWAAGQANEPGSHALDHADHSAGQDGTSWPAQPTADSGQFTGATVDGAAVAAYRASLTAGEPLSERKLAAMFGKTSRRWARHRMAEARGAP